MLNAALSVRNTVTARQINKERYYRDKHNANISKRMVAIFIIMLQIRGFRDSSDE